MESLGRAPWRRFQLSCLYWTWGFWFVQGQRKSFQLEKTKSSYATKQHRMHCDSRFGTMPIGSQLPNWDLCRDKHHMCRTSWLRKPHMVLRKKPGAPVCKTSALHTVYYLSGPPEEYLWFILIDIFPWWKDESCDCSSLLSVVWISGSTNFPIFLIQSSKV